MRFVYVLEDEPRFQLEISQALLSIDPKIQVRLFDTFKEFFDALQALVAHGQIALESIGRPPEISGFDPLRAGEAHSLNLIVSKLEFIGIENVDLLRRTQNILIDKKICTASDPTAWVLTSFEKPDFKSSDLTNRIITNIIYKPFDALILTQHLTFAVDGRHPPSKNSISNQKSNSIVEMLKFVETKAYSVLGAVTESSIPIPIGAVSKYYADTLKTSVRKSALGIVRSCQASANSPDLYQVFVQFFGLDVQQISNLRKQASLHKDAAFPFSTEQLAHGESLHAIMVGSEKSFDDLGKEWMSRLQGEVLVTRYHSLSALLEELDPKSLLDERPKGLKFSSAGSPVTLEFTHGLSVFVGLSGDTKGVGLIANVPVKTRKEQGAWFRNGISARTLPILNSALASVGALPQGGVLEWTDPLSSGLNHGPHYFLKIVDLKSAPGGLVSISLQELTNDEILAWYKSQSRLKSPVHAVFLPAEHIQNRDLESLKVLFSKFQQASFWPDRKPLIFLTAKQSFPATQEREWAHVADDLFFEPLDKGYILAKVQSLLSDVKIKDHSGSPFFKAQSPLKAASPIQILEISEAGFVMKYNRALELGSFREMVLWQPYEVGAPEMLAQCNFIEPVEGKKDEFKNHFVFFGATDHFLKNVRVWIVANYVLSKEKG